MIEVVHDGFPAWAGGERCCFCRKPTHFWCDAKDVAVCQTCAKSERTIDMVPTKIEWLNDQPLSSIMHPRNNEE